MPRPDNESKKIAEKILGVPKNMLKESKKKDKKIEQRLVFEETSRVR
jgi:hypothetical protein